MYPPRTPCRERPAESHRPLGEYLQQTDDGVQCTWCGAQLTSGTTPWKRGAHCVDRPLDEAGSFRESAAGLVLRMYICPTCATLLECDVALSDDPPVVDDVLSWPDA